MKKVEIAQYYGLEAELLRILMAAGSAQPTLLLIPNLLTIEEGKSEKCHILEKALSTIDASAAALGRTLDYWHLSPSGNNLDLECQLTTV